MRTLTVLFFVSLLAFCLVTFEASATESPVAETNLEIVEWTPEVDIISINAQDSSIINYAGAEGTEVARKCTRHDPRCIRFD